MKVVGISDNLKAFTLPYETYAYGPGNAIFFFTKNSILYVFIHKLKRVGLHVLLKTTTIAHIDPQGPDSQYPSRTFIQKPP